MSSGLFKASWLTRRLASVVALVSIAGLLGIGTISPASASGVSGSTSVAQQPCDQESWTGEDDDAHQISLPYSLPLGDTSYDSVFVTPNGVLTFGQPDGTFSTYPDTPSISVAGYDWVTRLIQDDYFWSSDGHVSYGATATGFCVEWQVRPFPGFPSDLTTIKLTVDTTQLPTWSGTVETSGWLPSDLRRGIRFAPGEDVVTISSAFVVNGGRPVEQQSCPDGSVIPMNEVCPAPTPTPTPSVTCWDGSLVFDASSCPAQPVTCWDGSLAPDFASCPAQPVTCWDGSLAPDFASCPAQPVTCWDGSLAPDFASCPAQPVTCWDGSLAPDFASCPTTPFINSITQARTAAWVDFALPPLSSGRYDRVAYSVDGGRWISWGLYAKSAQRVKGLVLGRTYSIRIKAHVKRGAWTGASAPVDIAMKRIVHGVLVP
jgi:hypothetical protein